MKSLTLAETLHIPIPREQSQIRRPTERDWRSIFTSRFFISTEHGSLLQFQAQAKKLTKIYVDRVVFTTGTGRTTEVIYIPNLKKNHLTSAH